MKAPRSCRLLNLRHVAYQTKGLKFRLDASSVAGHKSFPRTHWAKIHSTNPLECLNKEIKRRTSVVRIFPNEAAVTRLVGALMLEQNDERPITRHYMTLETVAVICDTAPMDPVKIATL